MRLAWSWPARRVIMSRSTIYAVAACALLMLPAVACTRSAEQPEPEGPAMTPAAGTPQGSPRAGRPGCRAQFEKFDDDDDGRVSREEFEARPHAHGDPATLFGSRDSDRDGALTEAEFCSGWRPGPAARQGAGRGPGPAARGPRRRMAEPLREPGCGGHFDAFDADHDGSLTFEEFDAWPHPRGEPRSLFDARDADTDGVVTRAEFCGGWRAR